MTIGRGDRLAGGWTGRRIDWRRPAYLVVVSILLFGRVVPLQGQPDGEVEALSQKTKEISMELSRFERRLEGLNANLSQVQRDVSRSQRQARELKRSVEARGVGNWALFVIVGLLVGTVALGSRRLKDLRRLLRREPAGAPVVPDIPNAPTQPGSGLLEASSPLPQPSDDRLAMVPKLTDQLQALEAETQKMKKTLARLEESLAKQSERAEIVPVPDAPDPQSEVVVGLAKDLRRFDASLQEMEKSMPGRIAPIEARLLTLEEAARASFAQRPSAPEDPLPALLGAERRLLRKSWEPFAASNPDLATLAREFASDANGRHGSTRSLVEELLGLPRLLEPASDLQRACHSAIRPLRDYYLRLKRLSLIPESIGDEGSVGDPSEAASRDPSGVEDRRTVTPRSRENDNPESELLRLRSGLQLLTILETTDVAERIRSFDLEAWSRSDFLRFADDLLRACQVQQGAELTAAWEVTREALSHAGVRAIPIELGTTPFDSKIHIGRSAAHESDRPDGVIVGVIRNGFVDAGSEKFLQRPEVVVNRA